MFQKIAVLGIMLLIFCSTIPLVSADDTTPPVTTIEFDPPDPNGLNGWYVSEVTIALITVDNESGVNTTYYRLNNATWINYSESFEITKDGYYFIEYYSVDNAGNIESIQSETLKLDKTFPTFTLFLDFQGGNPPVSRWFVEAEDALSGMDYVDFRWGGVSKFVDVEPPYEWIQIPEPPYSPFSISAGAFDKAGNGWYEHHWKERRVSILTGFYRELNATNNSISFHAIFMWNPIPIICYLISGELDITRDTTINHTGEYAIIFKTPHFIRLQLYTWEYWYDFSSQSMYINQLS